MGDCYWPARHAACMLRGKHRAGLVRTEFRAARLPPQAPADWLRAFVRRLTHRSRPRSATAPFAPNSRAKGLRLRSGLCRAHIHHRRMLVRMTSFVHWTKGSRSPPQPALCLCSGWVPLRYRLRGATTGSAIAQSVAPPHGAGIVRLCLFVVSLQVRCCLPSRVRVLDNTELPVNGCCSLWLASVPAG